MRDQKDTFSILQSDLGSRRARTAECDVSRSRNHGAQVTPPILSFVSRTASRTLPAILMPDVDQF